MKMLMVIFRASMIDEIERLLKQSDISAYSLLHNVEGKGETGNVVRTFFYPGTNSVILAMLSSEKADRVVGSLKAFHAARVQAAHGQAIPFKVFAFPCDELI